MNPALPSPDVSRLIVSAVCYGVGVMFLTLAVVNGATWLYRYFTEWPKRRSQRIVARAFPEAYDLAPMGAAGRKDDTALPLLDRETASREAHERASAQMRQIVEEAAMQVRVERGLARFDRRGSAQVPVPDVLLEAGSECHADSEDRVA